MDEGDEYVVEEDRDPAEEIERAMSLCGQTDIPGFCAHAGTEHCAFRCLFRAARARVASARRQHDPSDTPP